MIYKLITKVLSNRLQRVIGELVPKNQHAYIKGRRTTDCSLWAHELVRDFKKKLGSKSACFKIDLHEAFDSLNKEFIYFIMHCMKFPPLWISWIRECHSTLTFSIMVNGSASRFIESNRGIRQGDPLSPYNFVLAMEFWTIQMDLASAVGELNLSRENHITIYLIYYLQMT